MDFRFEKAHADAREVLGDAATIDAIVEGGDIHNIVADREIGAPAGVASIVATCGHGRPGRWSRQDKEVIGERLVTRHGNAPLDWV